jgi:DNA-binding LacI/PurR family transcriptional regulator
LDPSYALGPLLKALFISRASVARELGVSVQTIHNWCSGRVEVPPRQVGRLVTILRDRGAPSASVAEFVQRELEAYGIDPSLLVESARVREGLNASTVMIITWNLAHAGAFEAIARLCRQTLEHAGVECLHVDCGGEHRLKRSYIRQALSMSCLGVVLVGVPGDVPDPDDELLSAIAPAIEAGVPVVLAMPWANSLPLPRGAAAIGWDIDAAAGMAIDFLVESGHEEIGIFRGPNDPAHVRRYQGMDAALQRRGITPRPDLVAWASDEPDDLSDLTRVLHEATAIVAPPSVLWATARAFYNTALQWPEDVSVVTMGNSLFTPKMGRRPFTYVTLPIGKVSRGAAHLLISLTEAASTSYGQEYVIYGASSMSIAHPEDGSTGPPMRELRGAVYTGR